jgi:hypothetical protein
MSRLRRIALTVSVAVLFSLATTTALTGITAFPVD